MKQRKLTADELERVHQARHNMRGICGWMLTNRGDDYWRDVDNELCNMIFYKTTDGKPYVEQPEIGEGYRVATDADRDRADVEFWDDTTGEWEWRGVPNRDLFSCYYYRVPVDVIPTDDDARERPTVMVRDSEVCKWQKMTLLCVSAVDAWQFGTFDGTFIKAWRYCRFPYRGE